MNEDVEDRRQRSSTIHSTRATSSASGVSSVVCGGRATLRIKLRRGSGVSSACQPCASSRGPIRGALVAQRADCDCYAQRRNGNGVMITEVFVRRPIAELTLRFLKTKRAFPPTYRKRERPTLVALAASEAFGCRCLVFLVLAPACAALAFGLLLSSLSRLTYFTELF
jgi:hypothetical protein